MMEEQDHFKSGYSLQEAQDWDAASKEFLNVTIDNTDYDLARCGMAYCKVRSGLYQEAVAACEELLQLRNSEQIAEKLWLQYADENPYILAAYSLLKLGDNQGAGSMLDRFSRHSDEVIRKFFERSVKSALWLEICESKIQSPLVIAWKTRANVERN